MVVLQVNIQIGMWYKRDVAYEVYNIIALTAVDGKIGQLASKVSDIDDIVAQTGINGDLVYLA